MTSWLSRLHTTLPPPPPNTTTTGHPQTSTSTTTPLTPHTLARHSRDPNSTDYRFNINQKCIYERRLPGGSYITAHIQRLQSGYYDSPMVHEDRIENVRFVAVNFVFHPARSSARFKSAEISVAVRRVDGDDDGAEGGSRGGKRRRSGLVGQQQQQQQRNASTPSLLRSKPVTNPQSALIRSSDALPPPPASQRRIQSLRDSPPRFLRHAPHLLFGAISPETLTWNFNLAGSLGVSQGPANATLSPSGGVNGSYKLFEMMRIQGSMRGLHSWFGRRYNVEDGEIVWTLEENRLQKSGLPREFTFVMLLTKGSGNYEGVDDVVLDLDIKPVVGGFMGISNASFPGVVNNLMAYRPLHKEAVDLDVDVGQRFQPEEKGWGFNFAKLASDFDDFCWLPGKTWSTSEHGQRGDAGGTTADEADEKAKDGGNKTADKAPQLPMLSNSGDNTLNLRVILDQSTARGSPAPIAGIPLPYTSLRPRQPPYPHSRGPSPLHAVPAPSLSITGSQRSRQSRPSTSASQHKRRSITITSAHAHHAAGADSHGGAAADLDRRTSRSPTLRRRTSRSSLDKEYNSPPPPSSQARRARPYTIHDPLSTGSPHAHFPSSAGSGPQRPSSWYHHDDNDTSADIQGDEMRPPPRTADSSASQATVVRHALTTPSANAETIGGGDIGRHPSAASSSGRSGRVSVRQAKVAQTPYPSNRANGAAADEADETDQEEAVVVDVPKIAVPRKSSKRASGSHLRYVVESVRPAAPPAAAAASGGDAGDAGGDGNGGRGAREGGERMSNVIQQQEQPAVPSASPHERPGGRGGAVVSFNGALKGDGAGWTVDGADEDADVSRHGEETDASAPSTTGMVHGDEMGTTSSLTTTPAEAAAGLQVPLYRDTGFARIASGVFHDAAEELVGEEGEEVEGEKTEEKEKRSVTEGEFDRSNVF